MKRKKITLGVQRLALMKKYPNGICTCKFNQLNWVGKLRPTALSREYNIKVRYTGRGLPSVLLYGKNLLGFGRKDLPHHFDCYRKEGVDYIPLCLCQWWEFDSNKLLSDTIMPWILEWLYQYEIWLATGQWNGGGHTFSQN